MWEITAYEKVMLNNFREMSVREKNVIVNWSLTPEDSAEKLEGVIWANALELRYSTLDSHRNTGISHAVSPLVKMTMASKTVTRSIVVILLQIAMVGPGTHVVRNHEFQSKTNETHLKKNVSAGLKV